MLEICNDLILFWSALLPDCNGPEKRFQDACICRGGRRRGLPIQRGDVWMLDLRDMLPWMHLPMALRIQKKPGKIRASIGWARAL
jgi:hypothetical protein